MTLKECIAFEDCYWLTNEKTGESWCVSDNFNAESDNLWETMQQVGNGKWGPAVRNTKSFFFLDFLKDIY